MRPPWASRVVFDARGHFAEPHTGTEIGLGTLEVRDYLAGIRKHKVLEPAFEVREARYPTRGPKNRFGAIYSWRRKGSLRSSRRCSSPNATTSRS